MMSFKLAKIFVPLASVFFVGCASIQLAAVNLMALSFNSERIANLSYGPLAKQNLDIYRPDIASEMQPLPVVLFFHGGSWRDGSKNLYRFVAVTLAERGYLVVVPNYRKFPEVVFPAFVGDTAAAISWVIENADQYGGNPQSVFVMGHSSGAHMGALALADQRYLQSYAKQPNQVRGFIGLAGPYSFEPRAEDIVEVFAGLNDYSQMQVDTFVDGNEPKMLLLHGMDDSIVASFNSDRLKTALDEHQIESRQIFYQGIDHAGIIGEFAAPYEANSEVVADILAFIEQFR